MAQALEQVASKAPFFHRGIKVMIGGCDHPHVGVQRPSVAADKAQLFYLTSG